MPDKDRRHRIKRINTRIRIRAGELRMVGYRRIRQFGVKRYRHLAAIPFLTMLVMLVAWLKVPDLRVVNYRPIETNFVNPMSGWAVSAADRSGRLDTSLVYAEVTWRELEPEMNRFDFETFEGNNNLHVWWAEGKRLILRVVADRPGEAPHLDIPDWLFDMTGDGTHYTAAPGYGYSPNYSNRTFRERHRTMMSALGARYDGHPGIAYVEIGSLGADGLWHTVQAPDVLPLPASGIVRNYVWHYSSAWRQTELLMRRSYRQVRVLGLGIFTPMLGGMAAWDDFDTVIHGGYARETASDLYPMEDFWMRAPSGGHIATDIDLNALFTDNADGLLRQLSEGHLTYAVVGSALDDVSAAAIDGMRCAARAMGYRLWIRSALWDERVIRGYRASVLMTIRNDGTAPPFGRFKPVLALRRDGDIVHIQEQRISIADMVPGRSEFRCQVDVPFSVEPGAYELLFGLADAGMKPSVRLAMAECGDDLWTVLGDIVVEKSV